MQCIRKSLVILAIVVSVFAAVSCATSPTNSTATTESSTPITSFSQIPGTWVYKSSRTQTDSGVTYSLKSTETIVYVPGAAAASHSLVMDCTDMLEKLASLKNSDTSSIWTQYQAYLAKQGKYPTAIYSSSSPYTMTVTSTVTDSVGFASTTVTLSSSGKTLTKTTSSGKIVYTKQ